MSPRRRSGGYYGSWSNRKWAAWHDERRTTLSSRFFGIDQEVRRAFYGLTHAQLTAVLRSYESKYGSGARRYAEKTYPKWRSGSVSPSADTLARLLDCVPPVLPLADKAALIAQLRLRSRRPTRTRVVCTLADAEERVIGALHQLLVAASQHEIPSSVRNALSWLSSDSAQAAEHILRASEYIEVNWVTEYGRREVARMRETGDSILSTGAKLEHRFAHRIDSIYGHIDIEVNTRPGAGSQSTTRVGGSMAGDLTPRRSDSLIDKLTADLSEKEKQELRSVAARERISLEAKAQEAASRHDAAKADMDRDIDVLDRLQFGSPNSDYSMSGTYHGASGHTKVDVRRRDPTAAMVKWVAIGAAIVGGLWWLAA